jgi:hypothetical protein
LGLGLGIGFPHLIVSQRREGSADDFTIFLIERTSKMAPELDALIPNKRGKQKTSEM